VIPIGPVAAAVEQALRAPSVHNTQPWRWRVRDTTVDLFADTGRHLSATDPDRRDVLLSCGAALHHLRVALADAGLAADVTRLPDPENSAHLARVVTRRHPAGRPADAELFGAIARRHTDRRRFSHRPAPRHALASLHAAADRYGTLLVPAGQDRDALLAVLAEAAEHQRWVPGYAAELQLWTRRDAGARDGVPATALAAPPTGLSGPSGLRHFPRSGLPQPLPPPGHGLSDDAAEFLVLATADDAVEDRLRAGEALSAVLLTATKAGLATTTLSQGTELAENRASVRAVLHLPEHPQVVVRVGLPSSQAAELAPTPRRDLGSVLQVGDS
jgi:Nitroreductase family